MNICAMNSLKRFNTLCVSQPIMNSIRSMSKEIFPTSNEPEIPAYQEKLGESVEQRKARLLYQSRKRGMLENGLLLSTFAAKYLSSMNEEMLRQYDQLINLPSNDWDIYYWATGVRATPLQFNNDVMKLLQQHTKNADRQSRLRQPDLYETAK